MEIVPLVTGWSVSPKRGLFDGMNGSFAPPAAVTLPHDAMLAFDRSADAPAHEHSGYFPGGAVEYTRILELGPEAAGQVHMLVFDGVYRDAMVFVNDNFAAQWPGGYSRFLVNLDPFLSFDAPNTIRVESRAHLDSRWYSGLGIHRNVWLATAPLVHIAHSGVRVSTPEVDDDGALVQVETTVVNAGRHTITTRATVTLTAPNGEIAGQGDALITLLAGESGITRQRLWIASPERWSLGSPALFRAEVTLAADGESTGDSDGATFGIRSLQLDPRHGLRINGESVKLRGACIHHDNGIIGARAIARAEERRIQIMKDAGFNAIRSAHNPLSPETLDACDRIGMLVMDETFDMWAESKSPFDYSLSFSEWWERDVESLVAKNFNHPSVVFYSIGNEIPETGRTHGSRLGRLIAEKVRALDPTRFTTNSINGLVSVIKELPPREDRPTDINDAMAAPGEMMTAIGGSELVTQRTEESFGIVDAAGLNYGDSRYVSDASRFPNRVLIGTETFPTRLDIGWPLIMAHDHVIGEFTWTGWDYLGEAGIGRVDYVEPGSNSGFAGTSGPFPWQLAWCGDIDITGHRRPVSYYREIVFGLRAAPYIAVQRPRSDDLVAAGGPWSWSDSVSSWAWSLDHGTPLTVEVYSASEEVSLYLNDGLVGTAQTGPDHHYRSTFTAPFALGELVAVSSNAGVETGREVLRSATGNVILHVSADRDRIRSTPDDLAYITIAVSDTSGTIWADRDRQIAVSVTGPAELLGLGSANPRTTQSYLATSTQTFDGFAQAIVRPTGPGAIVITVESDGLESQSVEVMAG